MLEDVAFVNNSCTRVKVGFSAGKYYSDYFTSYTDKQQSTVKNLKLMSRCQQNKIIVELDNKEVNNCGSNTKGESILFICKL